MPAAKPKPEAKDDRDPSMPLQQARREKFAQLVASGKHSDIDCFEMSGYSRNEGNCGRVKGNRAVRARILYLQARAAEKASTTAADIARQLDEDRALAWANRNASACVQATMGKAKVLGLIMERHQVTVTKPIAEMNETELLALLGEIEEARRGTVH
ncbi:MAG: hypothetical protein VW405_00715 [Rhodospirillaceae bacterium]